MCADDARIARGRATLGHVEVPLDAAGARLALWISVLLAGCVAPSADRPDPPDDTPADTDPVDTDPVDTDLPDTDVPDTDTVDTEPPEEVLSPLSGTFVDVAAPALAQHALAFDLGGATDPESTAALLADVDGDGVREVILNAERNLPQPREGGVQVFRLVGGALVHDAEISEALSSVPDQVLGVLDLDRDGWQDLVLSRGVARGRGRLVWDPAPPWPIPDVPSNWGVRGSIVPVDVDLDGLLDLVVGDAPCTQRSRTWRIFLQEPGFGWTERRDLIEDPRHAAPWAVAALRELDGTLVMAVIGKACDFSDPAPGMLREDGTVPDGRPRFVAYDPFPANALFKQFSTIAGGPITLLNPMGLVVADLDGRGAADLMLTTSADFYHLFSGFGVGTLTDRSWVDPNPIVGLPAPQFAWGVTPVDLDGDGHLDLVVAHGDDPGTFVNGIGGPYYLRALRNDRRGAFVDVGPSVGLGDDWNQRSVHAADLDGDGDLEIGVGGYGWNPRLYRNDVTGDGNRLTVEVIGTTSGVAATGSWVEVERGGVVVARHPVPASFSPGGWVQPTLELGLGAEPSLERVRVRWASGLVQELDGLAAGQRHTVVEPDVISVRPASRSSPATRGFRVSIDVEPVDAQGLPSAATVEFVLVSGPGTWPGPTTHAGGVSTRSLQADGTPGTSVVEIRIDGVPLRTRPRIHWVEP